MNDPVIIEICRVAEAQSKKEIDDLKPKLPMVKDLDSALEKMLKITQKCEKELDISMD